MYKIMIKESKAKRKLFRENKQLATDTKQNQLSHLLNVVQFLNLQVWNPSFQKLVFFAVTYSSYSCEKAESFSSSNKWIR